VESADASFASICNAFTVVLIEVSLPKCGALRIPAQGALSCPADSGRGDFHQCLAWAGRWNRLFVQHDLARPLEYRCFHRLHDRLHKSPAGSPGVSATTPQALAWPKAIGRRRPVSPLTIEHRKRHKFNATDVRTGHCSGCHFIALRLYGEHRSVAAHLARHKALSASSRSVFQSPGPNRA
jgi:hypothetical protein